jgi:AAA family ATP:ADP antiporter
MSDERTGAAALVAPGPGDAVRAATLGAGLLIAQQVAARATRDAFYLSQFPVTSLPLASGLSALLSLGGVALFARGMAALSPARMMPLALSLGAVLLMAEWALSLVRPGLAAALFYLHVGLFGATLVSGFWSVVTERLDPHTARRSMGGVGTGASVGGVIGGLLTWRAAAIVPVPALLVGLAALNLLCLPIVNRLCRPSTTATGPGETGRWTTAASGWRLVAGVPYLRDLAVLIGLCALMEALLDYAFNVAAVARFERGAALVSFFALFHTGAGLLTLLVQATLARRALERLGLAGTLAVQPAAIAALGTLVAAWPRAAAVVLLRLSEVVLRNSLFRSGYELLYTPVALERKRPTKAIVDVACDRLGTVAGSAVVALVLLSAPSASTRVLVVLATVCAAVMAALAVRFHRAYLSALVDSLRKGVVRLEREDLVDATTRFAVESVVLSGVEPTGESGRRAAATSDGGFRGVAANQPAGGRSASAPSDDRTKCPPEIDDPAVRRLADLRSGDATRVRAALAPGDLEAAHVTAAAALLARDELFGEVLAALRRVAPRCTGQLVDVMLDPTQEPVVRRRIPRALVAAADQRAADGLMLALRDERVDLRYRAAQALVRIRQRNPALALSAADVLAAARRELDGVAASRRGVDHVFTILSLALEREPLEIALRAVRGGDEGLRGTALEYLDHVLPAAIRDGIWPALGAVRPAASGRPSEEIRDELLRSSSRWQRSASG